MTHEEWITAWLAWLYTMTDVVLQFTNDDPLNFPACVFATCVLIVFETNRLKRLDPLVVSS